MKARKAPLPGSKSGVLGVIVRVGVYNALGLPCEAISFARWLFPFWRPQRSVAHASRSPFFTFHLYWPPVPRRSSKLRRQDNIKYDLATPRYRARAGMTNQLVAEMSRIAYWMAKIEGMTCAAEEDKQIGRLFLLPFQIY
jgi:hypothetical protein